MDPQPDSSSLKGRGFYAGQPRQPNYNLFNRDDMKTCSNINENQDSERKGSLSLGRGKDDNQERFPPFPSGNRGRGVQRGRGNFNLPHQGRPFADTSHDTYQSKAFPQKDNFQKPSFRFQNPKSKGYVTSLGSFSSFPSSIASRSAPSLTSDQQFSTLNINKKKAAAKPEISLKPTNFVDKSGKLASLDSLVKALNPKEASDKFVVNAIVGISGCGKSTTWNEILKQPVFKTRQIYSSDNCDNTQKEARTPLGLTDGQSSESLPAKADSTEREFCPLFNSETGSVQVLLCQQTIRRWFVFDTQALLCPNNALPFKSQSKKPSRTPVQQSSPVKVLSSESSSKSLQNKQTKPTAKPGSKNTLASTQLQIANKNSTLFSLQTLTFLFVCSDNVVIILDPTTSLDELFSLLLAAIMIVRFPTSTLYFYIPESFLEHHLNPQDGLRSIQKRLIKHFRSKANFGLVTSVEELAILLNQPKICRYSALIDYSSEHSWIASAHHYWNDIDIPGNLLYQYCSEHEKISFENEDNDLDLKLQISSLSNEPSIDSKSKPESRNSNKSQAKSKIKVEGRPNTETKDKRESDSIKEESTSGKSSKTKRGGSWSRGKGGFWRGSSRGRGNVK